MDARMLGGAEAQQKYEKCWKFGCLEVQKRSKSMRSAGGLDAWRRRGAAKT